MKQKVFRVRSVSGRFWVCSVTLNLQPSSITMELLLLVFFCLLTGSEVTFGDDDIYRGGIIKDGKPLAEIRAEVEAEIRAEVEAEIRGLTGGQIAGIVIGVFAALVVGVFVGYTQQDHIKRCCGRAPTL